MSNNDNNNNYGDPDWATAAKDNDQVAGTGGSGSNNNNNTMSPVDLESPPSAADNYNNNNNNNTAAQSDSSSTGRGLTRSKLTNCTLIGISLFFLIIFIISASFQDNDVSASRAWLIYYILNVIVVVCYLVLAYCPCFKHIPLLSKLIMAFTGFMIVWSIVFIGISAKKLSDAPQDGGKDAGGDSENLNDREEKAFETAGATLGLVSAIYHIVTWKLCHKRC